MTWIASLHGPFEGSLFFEGDPARAVLRELGPTAVPYLVRGAAWRPSLRDRFVSLVVPLQVRLGLEGPVFTSADWQALQNKQQSRNGAVILLGFNGKAAVSALPVLRRILNQPDDALQQAHRYAISALLSIGPEEQDVPTLIRLLTSEPDVFRFCAAESLGRLGPAARPAIPALQQALVGSSPSVQTAIRSALLKIAPGEVTVPPP